MNGFSALDCVCQKAALRVVAAAQAVISQDTAAPRGDSYARFFIYALPRNPDGGLEGKRHGTITSGIIFIDTFKVGKISAVFGDSLMLRYRIQTLPSFLVLSI